MEIPVHARSLKSSILSPTSFQMGKTFCGVVGVAVEQSRCKANMVAQIYREFGPEVDLIQNTLNSYALQKEAKRTL